MSTIGIIGAGAIGSAFAKALAGKGLEAIIANSRGPASLADLARELGPTITPGAPASAGEELALLTEARRVPVVDGDGRLLGIVSVTGDLTSFCGTG